MNGTMYKSTPSAGRNCINLFTASSSDDDACSDSEGGTRGLGDDFFQRMLNGTDGLRGHRILRLSHIKDAYGMEKDESDERLA